MDRIDLQIEVSRLDEKEILAFKPAGETSNSIRERVNKARQIQVERFKNDGIVCNAQMSSRLIRKHCMLNKASEDLLIKAIKQMQLSARAYDRILKLSRSIADLYNDADILEYHIAEALQYRNITKFI